MGNSKDQTSDLVLEMSLQSYFFDQLESFNKKSTRPLPKETVYYSSLVMDKFGDSQNYFEVVEGKFREKILGQKLLETSSLSREGRKRELKDIGDTALFLCGYFSESLNKKIVDTRYYQEVGQMAYSRLDAIVPSFYEVDSFYKNLSVYFEKVVTMISLVSNESLSRDDEQVLLFVSNNQLKAS